MRIPIYIGRRHVDQPLPSQTQMCTRCQAQTSHQVMRHYMTVSVYGLPFMGRSLEYRYTCTRCGAKWAGQAPKGVPSIPFFHRMGCVVVMGVPLLALMGYAGYAMLESKWRREAYEAKQKATAEAVELSKQAKSEAESATKKCFEALNASLAAGTSGKKIIDMEPVVPANPAALKEAQYVVIKHGLSESVPRPNHPYFGTVWPCDAEVPRLVKDAARNLTGGSDFSPEKAKEEAEKLLEKARALKPPTLMAVTDYACRDKTKMCTGVSAWISVADNKVLAVTRVEKPMEHLGYQKDADELAPLLRIAVEKW